MVVVLLYGIQWTSIRLTVLVSNELDALASVHSEAITLLVGLPVVLIFPSFFVHIMLGPRGHKRQSDQFVPGGKPVLKCLMERFSAVICILVIQ